MTSERVIKRIRELLDQHDEMVAMGGVEIGGVTVGGVEPKYKYKKPGEKLSKVLMSFPKIKPESIGEKSKMASKIMKSGCGIERKLAWTILLKYYILLKEMGTKEKAISKMMNMMKGSGYN